MNSRQVERILRLHTECGIPLQHSVAMLFRVKGVSLGTAAKQAGYQRTYLYKTLSGELAPSPRLRETMESMLGVDPWAIHASGEAGARIPDDRKSRSG
ncbi:MAG: hypothetical protein L0Y43_05840 [Methylococcaceae bacterium]|nr:hypothetical protein [Methylococcaceae bacterium]